MFFKYSLTVGFFILFWNLGQSQDTFTSEEALEQYKLITNEMSKSFPEDEFKTYRRTSFSESQLETYLSQHFKRLDLLSYIAGNYTFKLDAYLHSGNWFNLIGFPKESNASYKAFFEHYKQYEALLSQQEKADYVEMITFANSIMAANFEKMNLFKRAEAQHKIGMKFADTLKNIYHPSSINNYALFLYHGKRELDSALFYFKKALRIAQTSYPNHTLNGSIRDNIADIYRDKQNFIQARALYFKNFNFFQQTKNEKLKDLDYPRLISAGAQLIEMDIKLNHIEEAANSFKRLDEIYNTSEHSENILPESKIEFLTVKQLLLKKQNRAEEAYNTLQQLYRFSDSLNNIAAIQDKRWRDELNVITLDRVALNFEIEQIQKANKIKNQKLQFWIMCLILTVVIIVLLYLYKRRKQRMLNAFNKQLLTEQKLENASLKLEQLNHNIKAKERDLSDFAINLTQNYEWIKSLSDQLNAYKNGNVSEKPELLKNLEVELQNKINYDKRTKVFFERLDTLNNGFYNTLTTKFPSLTKNEIRLCSLIRLKISSRNIATLQNITLASLNTSRYRLRKKLNLPDDINLDDYILSL
ncbi:transcriptional regulator [Aestuariibaculum sediminum]|uniref:Tetratricopeptide repeat protein n=1 Tax=Aestuariibaculum sediminum TaxID=2770637 RepID=A0A8J6UC47_9FLAO|nr:tetratricopeptide repeat protein [Aestuariibaculum sediminum]MBD0831989.1 tetratricopeptide repeat protein [Aestuariibaculum sediminum]